MNLELATPPEFEAEIAEMQRLMEERGRRELSEAKVGNLATKVVLIARKRIMPRFETHSINDDGTSEWGMVTVGDERLDAETMGRMPGVMSPVEELEWQRFLSRRRAQISRAWRRQRNMENVVH